MNDDEINAKIQQQLERKRSEEWIKNSEGWLNRLAVAGIGFVIGLTFAASLSECTQLHHRLDSLESKQK